MSLKELREKDNSHIQHELAEKLKHLFELRSQAVTEKLEDPSQLKKTRREIAQIRTLIRQREIETAAKKVPASVPEAVPATA
jgi:large subunit ribosomal protein L29